MGGSGGGGSSGAVDYPLYMQVVHGNWLDHIGHDIITTSITEVMNASMGSSPWLGKAAYNPDADIASYEASLAAFKVILSGVIDTTDWADLYAQAETTLVGVGEITLTADVTAYAAIVDDNINTVTLPRFRRGMQDINAVSSSAFVVGEAIIEGFRDRDVAKYAANLRTSMGDRKLTATDQMLQLMARRIGWEEGYARTMVEAKRIKIVAKTEQTNQNDKLDEADALWDFECFQYGANLLAGIGGGTTTPNTKKTNTNVSALGGALSGAAAGAMIGTSTGFPIVGTLVGAVLGAASAFL